MVPATVSAELSPELVETDGLRESLAEIFASHEEFQKFFSGVFSELDVLSAELVRRQQAWTSERSRTETELEERAARLEADRAALAAEREQAWEEISQRRREVEQEQGQSAAAGDESLKRMFEEAEQERAAMRAALQAAQAQNERLAQVAEELMQARGELGEARQEIERLSEGLQKGHGESAALPDSEVQDRLQRMEQERAQLDQERSVLESELDMVRNRAAEMSETLAQQQREMAEERQRWSAELKRMRRVLEALSTRQVEIQGVSVSSGKTGGTAAPADRSSESASASPPESDPVLGSVMAQFEMLQKDIVRRRKDAAKSK